MREVFIVKCRAVRECLAFSFTLETFLGGWSSSWAEPCGVLGKQPASQGEHNSQRQEKKPNLKTFREMAQKIKSPV